MKKILIAAACLAILLLPSLSLGETAVYDPIWTAPSCTSGVSPCVVPTSLINGRDNMDGGAEPNSPNTLSTSPCADGADGTYHSEESVDAVTITDLSGPDFMPGDTIRVDATVWGYGGAGADSLYVYLADNPLSPAWNYQGAAACQANGQQVLSVSFKLETTAPMQAIRTAFDWDWGGLPVSCYAGYVTDWDDVVIVINSPDADGDGMPDFYEQSHACLNPAVADGDLDPDGDGMSSLQEYLYSEALDPCDHDNDGDGLPDGWEVQYPTCGLDPLLDNDAEIIKIGPDLRVSSGGSGSYYPSLAWTGSEYGVSWDDNRDGNYEIYFARISAAGAKIGPDHRVTSYSHGGYNPSLSWTGSEYGVSWQDYRDGSPEIYFARISAAGTKLGSDLRVTSEGDEIGIPHLSWTGSEFGVSWDDRRDLNYDIMFARISAAGAKIGADSQVTSSDREFGITFLIWTGSEYGVSWENGYGEIFFAQISAAGAKIGSELRVTYNADNSVLPSLSWTGSEYGVSWWDDRDGNFEIYFARISAAGAKIGSDLRVTSDCTNKYFLFFPSLSWIGSEYGLGWFDDHDGNNEIFFARISADGAMTGPEFRVTSDGASSKYPSLFWTGSEYGVSWQDGREGTNKIYFARIRLGQDYDGDGLPNTEEYSAGTNPCNPDTDGDGMKDGYEVARGRNPLVKDAPPRHGGGHGGCMIASPGPGQTVCRASAVLLALPVLFFILIRTPIRHRQRTPRS